MVDFSGVDFLDILRSIDSAMRQRNAIEKEKLDILKKIERDLRKKSEKIADSAGTCLNQEA